VTIAAIRRHVEVLAKEFRSMALVAGQFSVEGTLTPDRLRAAGEAKAFAVCAEMMEALLRADTEGDRQEPLDTDWDAAVDYIQSCVSQHPLPRDLAVQSALTAIYRLMVSRNAPNRSVATIAATTRADT
jgi:hypothetical protein